MSSQMFFCLDRDHFPSLLYLAAPVTVSREFLFSSHSLSRDFVYVHHTFALTPSLSPVQEFPKIPSRYSSTRSFYKIDMLHALRQQRIYYPWPIFLPASTLFLLRKFFKWGGFTARILRSSVATCSPGLFSWTCSKLIWFWALHGLCST